MSSSSLERLPSLRFYHPSTASVNVASFVPTKLGWLSGIPDTNYETWKEQMLCLIKSQGLTPYIDGSISLPLGPNQEYEDWYRNNALVKGWILGALSDQIVSTFIGFNTANQIWAQLEKKFGCPKQSYQAPKKSINDTTPMHRAALNGDWEAAQQIFNNDPEAKMDWIDGNENWRLLHVAVGTGKKAVKFVNELVKLLSADELLSLRDADNSTALHIAASVGNREAAFILVEKNPDLCYQLNRDGHFPVHVAALYVQREVLEYLIQHTKGDNLMKPYSGLYGQLLLTYLIQAEFFDIALLMAKDYPYMLNISLDEESPLTLLAIKKNTLGTRKFNFWECLISTWVEPMDTRSRSLIMLNGNEVEGWNNHIVHQSSVLWKDFRSMRWKCVEFLVPDIKEKMRVNEQAQQLLICICKEIGSQDFTEAAEIFHEAIFAAAELGVREVVEVIIETFPGVIYSLNKLSGQHIFHKAIENRSVNVFNLIYEMSDHKSFFTSYVEDNFGNNPLHSAGKLAPPHRLGETSGAALQMQREMQWFQEVEEIVHPCSREQKNNAGKTPKMVFTEEHSFLKEAGEKWMKETANSLTLVAALISTVMFTGAITVPGGNESSTGFPMFSGEPVFIAFAVSDAASLFSSATSLLLFLAILTSRYAEEDFLSSLPMKLMFGLASLFLSIISMMASFIATLYLVFGKKKEWVIFPLLIFSLMPVASFVLFQFPLLRALYSSTYGRGIFVKKSKRRFY